MENNFLETIKKFIEDKDLVLIDTDQNSCIVRYQMNAVSIYLDPRDNTFCSVSLLFDSDITEENFLKYLMICNSISNKQKVIKAYLTKDSFIIAYEFNFERDEELVYQLGIGLETVVNARAVANRLLYEMEVDAEKKKDQP